jgi:hypothetical protein
MASIANGCTENGTHMDKPNLTPEQMREELSMDIILKLRQMGCKPNDNCILAICTACFDIIEQATKS